MNKKCQVFTPAQNVKEILNFVGYKKDLYGKKIIENACGDGNILEEVVRRYIKDALKKNKSVEEIKAGLQEDIYGAEIDKKHYLNCINKLDNVAKSYGIKNVQWNIFNGDFLKKTPVQIYDFVVGNPPYITYRDLDEETRGYLRENFISCKQGKFDYCYAFVEASISCLKDGGKFAYLVPSSIFKNVFAETLRNMILPDLTNILDYTTKKLFTNTLTSSAILVCKKGVNSKKFAYNDVASNKKCKIEKSILGKKWIFSENQSVGDIGHRFGDYFNASISVATLYNKAYVIKDFLEEEEFIVVDKYRIERKLIRKGVSPRSINYQKEECLLFPYQYVEGSLVRYSTEDFEKNFPEAVKYLKSHSKKLENRKSDGSINWFEYGRSQALAHLDQPKLLLSTVVTKEVKVYELEQQCIPYSGIYIIPIGEFSLSRAKEILESKEFYEYVKEIGINASGRSLRITAKDVNNFMF